MFLLICRRKLLQINVKHPTSLPLLRNPFFKSVSNLSHSPNDPSLTLSYLINNSRGLSSSKEINLNTTQNPDSVFQFFKTQGLSNAQTKTIVSATPRFLTANVDKTLKPKVEFFRSLGLSDSDITRLITSDPSLLLRSLKNQIIPSINFLRNLLHTNENAVRAFRRCRWLVTSHVKDRMESNIAVLKELGLPDSQITDIAKLRPAILAQKTDSLMEVVKRVEELGLQRSTGLFAMALLAMSTMKKSTWEAKLEMLKSIGWTEPDILKALRKMPIFIKYSEKKIRAAMDFFTKELKWKPSHIANDPIFIMFSLEKRLKPRSRVWKMLRGRELVDERELKRMIKLPEEEFLRCYLTKYDDQLPYLLKAYKGE